MKTELEIRKKIKEKIDLRYKHNDIKTHRFIEAYIVALEWVLNDERI